jgi:Integrase core domain
VALIAAWVQTYNTVRLHSALQYLTPWDYYRGDPTARLADRRTKLQAARPRRREAWEACYAAAHPAACLPHGGTRSFPGPFVWKDRGRNKIHSPLLEELGGVALFLASDASHYVSRR